MVAFNNFELQSFLKLICNLDNMVSLSTQLLLNILRVTVRPDDQYSDMRCEHAVNAGLNSHIWDLHG
jgi:hypothetical protein